MALVHEYHRRRRLANVGKPLSRLPNACCDATERMTVLHLMMGDRPSSLIPIVPNWWQSSRITLNYVNYATFEGITVYTMMFLYAKTLLLTFDHYLSLEHYLRFRM